MGLQKHMTLKWTKLLIQPNNNGCYLDNCLFWSVNWQCQINHTRLTYFSVNNWICYRFYKTMVNVYPYETSYFTRGFDFDVIPSLLWVYIYVLVYINFITFLHTMWIFKYNIWQIFFTYDDEFLTRPSVNF